MAKSRKDIAAASREWGAEAERIAQEHLIKEGYAIRETNWRLGKTIEIDIIAQLGTTMVFVEVKARNGEEYEAASAVDLKKQRKICKGADCYLRSLPFMFEFRLDVITITGNRDNYKLEHIPDAFLPQIGW